MLFIKQGRPRGDSDNNIVDIAAASILKQKVNRNPIKIKVIMMMFVRN